MGKIRIDTGFNLTGLQKGWAVIDQKVKSISNTFGSVGKSISNAFDSSRVQNTTSAIMKQQAVIDELKRKIESINDREIKLPIKTEKIEQLSELQSKISEMQARADKLEWNVKGKTIGFKEAEEELNGLYVKLDDAQNKSKELNNEINNLNVSTQPKESVGELNTKLEVANQKLAEMQEKANSTGKTTPSAMSKFGDNVEKYIKKMNLFSNATRKSTSTIGSWLKRIKSTLTTVLVFQVLRKAFAGLKDYIGLAIRQNELFVKSWGQIKGNLAIAFQPILDTVIPILAKFLEWLVKVTAQIAIFFNMLLGKSLKASIASAKTLDKQAKALGGVSKAAETTTNTLDELAMSSKDSGGNGSSDISTLFDFDFSSLKNPFKNWGLKLAEWLNKEMNSIPWEKIKQSAKTTAEKLANNINDFTANFEWKTLGNTIAQGLNTAIIFAKTFLKKTKWYELGYGIGQTITSFFENVDWKDLAETVTEFGVKLWEFLTGIVEGIDWEKVGESIVEYICNIDASKIQGSALKFVWTLIKAIGSLLVGMSKQLGLKMAEVVSNLVTSFKEKWEELWSNIGAWLKEKIVDPFINFFKELFGIASPSKLMEYLSNMLVEGILGPLSKLPEKVKTAFTNMYNEIKKIFNSIGDYLSNTLKKPLNAMIDLINKLLSGLGNIKLPDLLGGKSINIKPIPRLATGTVLPGGDPYLAVVNDQPRGQTNVETPLSTIEQAVDNVLARRGGGSTQEELQLMREQNQLLAQILAKTGFYLDGKDLLTSVENAQSNRGAQTGGVTFRNVY